MINELTHDYIALELPNVVLPVKKGEIISGSTVAHPFLHGLVTRLAKARPKWTIIVENRLRRGDDTYWVTRFRIWEGREELGVLEKTYFQDGDAFLFDNTRLAAARQRGHGTRTKSESKAFKTIIKSFGAKTVTERLNAATDKARERVLSAYASRRSMFHSTQSTISEAMTLFVRDHYEAFAKFAEDRGIHSGMVDEFPDRHQAFLDTRNIAQVSESGEGIIVMLHDSDYVVRVKDEVSILTNAELTPHLRRSIGMLKLVAHNQHIANVGVRACEDVFFIVPEPKDDER